MNLLQKHHIDRYLIATALLIVTIFSTAGALMAYSDSKLQERQCTVAAEWLNESADLSDRFTSGGSMLYITSWLSGQDELNTPRVANPLRWAILDSARYLQATSPQTSTRSGTVLYIPAYTGRIDAGAAQLLAQCPEVKPLLQKAFPMVFKENGE